MQNTLKMSDACAIALHAVTYIAEHTPKACSTADIAARYKVSPNHLSKVIQRLNKAGFLSSVKGPLGGSVINKNIKRITFLDIYEAIEGKLTTEHCMLKERACKKDATCILGATICDINKILIKNLSKTVIYARR